jgi:carbon storage regulator
MLILTRKPGEAIVIGDNIKVTFVEIKGNQIRLGIDAPRDVKVYRQEIFDQIQAENLEAAQSQGMQDLEGLAAAMNVKVAPKSPLGQLTTAKVGVDVTKRSKK